MAHRSLEERLAAEHRRVERARANLDRLKALNRKKLKRKTKEKEDRQKSVLGAFVIAALDPILATQIRLRLLAATHRPQDRQEIESILERLLQVEDAADVFHISELRFRERP